jgi:putative ABC transport system permease protein
MFKNYLKVALRNLARHKLFTFINIFGLALSMSVCLMVLVAIKDQISYDKFHPHPEKTYRIITELTDKEGRQYRLATTALPLAINLSRDFNIIDKSVRIYPIGSKNGSSESKELLISAAFTEPDFFKVFGFTLKSGHADIALINPNSIVLNSETAAKYFGEVDPIGKVISLGEFGNFEVKGVLDKPKGKSHIDFECLISMASLPFLERSGKMSPTSLSWNNYNSGYTYVTLKQSSSKKQLVQAVGQIGSLVTKNTTKVGKENYAFDVQPLNDIILGEELGNRLGNTGSLEKVLAMIVIGFVILLSACFNYTNLSLARSLKRGKEVGVRKVAGAFRLQIFYQFIIESIVIALLSLILAILFFKLLNDYAPFGGGMIPEGSTFDMGLFSWFFIFALFTGLLAGALPAWALSSFKPVEVLKNLANIKLFGSTGLRKGLIVIQFALSLVIIVFTLTFHKQFRYLSNGDAGYNAKSIVNIPVNSADYNLLANRLMQLKGVESISATSVNLGRNSTGNVAVKQEKDRDPIHMEYYDVDPNFIKNMGLTLIAGSSFDSKTSDRETSVVISDLARKILQFKSPGDAIGQSIWINDTTQVQITGVLKDFYYRGLETQFGPMILRHRPEQFRYLHVKTTTATGDKAMMASIERIWKQTVPLKTFEATWLYDEIFARKGAWDQLSMLGFLAIITITLACMGLLGMVVYNTETRKKEIGIRKVMGASVTAIIALLSKSFIKLVIIAGFIALPIGYGLSFFFLNIFANRISVGFGILAFSFTGMLLLSLITIGSQIYRVAVANPVNALHAE